MSGSRYVSNVFSPAGFTKAAQAVRDFTSHIQYRSMKTSTLAPALARHQVGVARIFEMPSGASSHAAISVAAAKASARSIFSRSRCQRCMPRKIVEVTTPAIVIEAGARTKRPEIERDTSLNADVMGRQ